MVRYADDFVILCRSEAEARAGLGVGAAMDGATGLTLHPEKTRIVDATQRGGFDFLGYHFERGYRWPRREEPEEAQRHDSRAKPSAPTGRACRSSSLT